MVKNNTTTRFYIVQNILGSKLTIMQRTRCTSLSVSWSIDWFIDWLIDWLYRILRRIGLLARLIGQNDKKNKYLNLLYFHITLYDWLTIRGNWSFVEICHNLLLNICSNLPFVHSWTNFQYRILFSLEHLFNIVITFVKRLQWLGL